MNERSGFVACLAALVVLVGSVPAPVTAEPLSDDAFEERLSTMQQRARDALAHYEAGETDAALEDATFVRDQFTFNGTGASRLEETIREESALAIADQVKAQASRYASAIEAGEDPEDVEAILSELEPSLNRLVLVAQGKHTPASQRQLKSEDAIRDAADDVRELIDEAVDLYARGQVSAAEKAARDAFFAFEQGRQRSGIGPDVATVDEPLENEVENKIVNFDTASRDTMPGLAGLIARNASLEKVQSKADEIHDGIDQIVELLIATKPPTDLGDANRDGDVTIVDALLTAQASLGIRSEDAVMDANQDGQVTIVDALMIAQAALGIRSL